ncbi:hypothetical protein FWG76_01465 [Candidatus Saccharibacteria bacterium]|nr:hypothetical protein [Candidatus Saccharibacteria bacterium]
MNNNEAIASGNLAGKSLFFGSAQAETVTHAASWAGGWNSDSVSSPIPTSPWNVRGGAPDNLETVGIFFSWTPGGAGGQQLNISHRTILLGY